MRRAFTSSMLEPRRLFRNEGSAVKQPAEIRLQKENLSSSRRAGRCWKVHDLFEVWECASRTAATGIDYRFHLRAYFPSYGKEKEWAHNRVSAGSLHHSDCLRRL
jgi:hypothetical protein